VYTAFELQLCLLQRHVPTQVLSPKWAGALNAARVVTKQQTDLRMDSMTTQVVEVHPGQQTTLCLRTIGRGADRTGTIKGMANDKYMTTDYSDIDDPQNCRLA
jgi:hypothetical protein